VGVASGGAEAIRYAAGLPRADFEDAMQVACARACATTRMITRSVREYKHSRIHAISPHEALDELF